MSYYARSERYLRTVANADWNPRRNIHPLHIVANLTQIFRPRETSPFYRILLREIEGKFSKAFNIYQIIPPQRFLAMYEALGEHHDNIEHRQAKKYPDWTVREGELIYRDLVYEPPLEIRQILGDPVNNGIALDARMAFLFQSVTFNLTRSDQYIGFSTRNHDVHELERTYGAATRERHFDGLEEAEVGYDIREEEMTVQEALELLQLFRRCMNQTSSVFKATNVTATRLTDAMRALYLPGNAGPDQVGTSDPDGGDEYTAFQPPRRTSMWERAIQRFMPSYHGATIVLEILLWEERRRIRQERPAKFRRTRSQAYLLQELTPRQYLIDDEVNYNAPFGELEGYSDVSGSEAGS